MSLDNTDIIFVSNALANGGAARVICVLATELARRGKKVGIAVYAPHEGEYAIPRSVLKEYGPNAEGLKLKVGRILWLRNLFKRNGSATIVAFEYFVNMQVILACLGLRNRVILSERNDPARVGNDLDWLRERLYRRADMLICQTGEAASYFSDKVKKRVILNPIKEGLPSPHKGARRKAVVAFCRLERQKNLPMLVRAFSRFREVYPDYTLEIYGDGKERSALISLINDFNLSTAAKIFPGRPDVHGVVRDAAMFVLPSDYEGLSNSMLEAMAIGLPVICTDCPCGGARMVIDDGENGLLIPVGNEDALLLAMIRIASNPSLGNKLSAQACAISSRLDVSSIVEEWKEVIDAS